MGIHFWEWFIPIPLTAQVSRAKWCEFECDDFTNSYLRTNAREQMEREARQRSALVDTRSPDVNKWKIVEEWSFPKA
jgi:hypothetical protein